MSDKTSQHQPPKQSRQGNLVNNSGINASRECHCITCGMPIGWPTLHFNLEIGDLNDPGLEDPNSARRDPRAWLGKYRVIIERNSYGIREDVFLSEPTAINESVGPLFILPPMLVRPGPLLKLPWKCKYGKYGYPIHERCWQLTEVAVGQVEARANLDELFLGMLSLWHQPRFPFGLEDRLVRKSHLTTGVHACAREGNCFVGDELCRVNARWDETANPELDYTEWDPLHLPSKTIFLKDVEVCLRSDEPMTPIPSEHPTLSLELKLMIADCLEPLDLANTLKATGWRLPDSYCRALISEELLADVEEMAPQLDKEFDFNKLLIMEGMTYTGEYRGYRNCKRILDIIHKQKIRAEQLKRMGKQTLRHDG